MNNQLGQHFILLRGLTRESGHWGEFVPMLRSTFPEARLTQLDLPGSGPYFRETSPETVRGILEKVRSHTAERGSHEPPATLVAVSLGGMVAWEWLLAFPEEICGAVLINISLGGLSPFYHRLRWQCYVPLAKAVLMRRVEDREPELLRLLSNCEDRYEQLAETWVNIQKVRPVSAKNAYRQLRAAATYTPEDRKPDRPVLLLNSLGDRLVAPSCSEVIQQKWNLELRTHPWGGHDLTLDDGAWVLKEMCGWLERERYSI